MSGVAAMDGGTVARALAAGAARLREAGVEGARRDARLLLAAALGVSSDALRMRPERPLNAGERVAFESLLARRARREPVSRIVGVREFWSLPFKITPDTLDPRPDSETLVDAVLGRIADRDAPLDILDLGTGSGCLLLALLSDLPAARGLGVDISEPALAVARENAAALGLGSRADFLRASWGAALGGTWQVIVSNPPYILSSEIPDLAPEVQDFDPLPALAGGPDGLDAYRILAPDIARLLDPGGLAALEIGAAQIEPVEALLRTIGLKICGRVRDLAENWRCVLAEKTARSADWRK